MNDLDANLISSIVDAIQDKKGKDISILNLKEIHSASTGYFIICNGSSISQTSAIADNIRNVLNKEYHLKPNNYEGYRNAQWIILDYGDFMIHIFIPEFRNMYNLEELWNDAQITEIPNLD